MTASEVGRDTLHDAVERELNDLSEDMFWTEKAHFALAERLSRTNLWLGLGSTIAASIAAATVIADIAPVVTGVCALIAAIASGLLTFLKPQDAETAHLTAARQLGALRVQIRQILRIELPHLLEQDPQPWRELVTKFAHEKARIDQDAPGTSRRAFDKAREKIDAGHFDHESDSPHSS